jgi:hypothetical protein
MNIKKVNKSITKLLNKKETSTKIDLYFATKTVGEDFDSYEKNYTYTNLNPVTIKAYVNDLTGEQAFYKQYGIHHSGIKSVICEDKYEDWFKRANKIVIDDDEFEVFKDSGGQMSITKRPFKLIRITIVRK